MYLPEAGLILSRIFGLEPVNRRNTILSVLNPCYARMDDSWRAVIPSSHGHNVELRITIQHNE